MKRKLLYLIPIVLAVLCLTPSALHKDTVGFSGKAPLLESLAPSSWKLLDFNVSADVSLSSPSDSTADTTSSANSPLSNGASFKGFPFGAYFQNSSSSTNANGTSSSNVSAWSWLWASVDGLIIIITLLLAIHFNRLRHDPTATQPAVATTTLTAAPPSPNDSVPPVPTPPAVPTLAANQDIPPSATTFAPSATPIIIQPDVQPNSSQPGYSQPPTTPQTWFPQAPAGSTTAQPEAPTYPTEPPAPSA